MSGPWTQTIAISSRLGPDVIMGLADSTVFSEWQGHGFLTPERILKAAQTHGSHMAFGGNQSLELQHLHQCHLVHNSYMVPVHILGLDIYSTPDGSTIHPNMYGPGNSMKLRHQYDSRW